MKYTVYILFSTQLNKYYIGKTSLSIEERLLYHLHHHKGFTAKAKDWIIIHTEMVNSNSDAIQLEKKIKKRGAKRYILSLSNK